MGGRLDATNIVHPLVSVITNISLDHQEFLGDNLLAVAGEKAGIIKPGAPLVTFARQRRVLELFRERCRDRSPHPGGRSRFSGPGRPRGRFSYEGPVWKWQGLSSAYRGVTSTATPRWPWPFWNC